MAPGDVCHGPLCSLAGLGPAALGYRPRSPPGGSAWSPLCVRPIGCCLLFPVPRPPYVRTCVRCRRPLGSCSPVCSLRDMCCVCGVLDHLAPVHRCARSVCCAACAVSLSTSLSFTGVPVLCAVYGVSLATWLLFTGVPARCVVSRVRGVLGHLAPLHRCAPLVRCVVCAVSLATWLLFTGVSLGVQCPGPVGSSSAVCPLGALCRVCGVRDHLAPVQRCARSVYCVACAVSLATWLLFTGVLVRCAVCAVSLATWLLFTGVPARCIVLHVWCLEPLGYCSPVCPLGHWQIGSCLPGVPARCVCRLGVLCWVCGVFGHFAPVHRCAHSKHCVACVVSLATWLLFTGVPARCVVLRVQFPGPLGSCSPLCPLGVLCCVCGVLGLLSPVHRCAPSVCCVACAVFWVIWLLFTGVPTPCVLLRVRCPGPRACCLPLCPLSVLCCVCGFLGHLASVHSCARGVRCPGCAVPWATWLPFTGVPARSVVLLVRCPWPLGSCSSVCLRGVLCCVSGVLSHFAPVHRCAHSVRCVACALSWAAWLLFTGVPARCVVLCVRCPWPLGSCSRCAPSVLCVAYAVVRAPWLLFSGVQARCVVLPVQYSGQLRSCSSVCSLSALCCVCGVFGHLAPAQWCARSVSCAAFAVSLATWNLFTRVCARCVVLRVQCPWLLASCSAVCPLGVLCCVCGDVGHLAGVHRCACALCCPACAVSLATWLLFIGLPARCVLLGLCGHVFVVAFAPVRTSRPGAHSFIRTAAVL